MIQIALIFIVAVTTFSMGWIGGQAWQGRCERLLNPRAGSWEGDE